MHWEPAKTHKVSCKSDKVISDWTLNGTSIVIIVLSVKKFIANVSLVSNLKMWNKYVYICVKVKFCIDIFVFNFVCNYLTFISYNCIYI